MINPLISPIRVVSDEEKTHKLSEEKEVLGRSVKELTSGLQDLAREHQMLQVFHTRQRDKRWEKDDEVEQCASCTSKFSVSNRKVCLCVCVFVQCMYYTRVYMCVCDGVPVWFYMSEGVICE